MEENNPYNSLEAPPAAFAAANEKAAFLKKVYGLLLLGVLGFAGTLWATANIGFANDLAMSLGRTIYGNRWGMLIYFGIFMAGQYGVHALAEVKPINKFAYAGWVVLLGFLTAPFILFVAGTENGMAVINQASAATALIFGGLTVYVLWSGKDFSWLRGILVMAFWALIAVAILGYFTGYTPGVWLSGAVVLLLSGYILYDTSVILHHLPTNAAMTGAILLFTDVALLFKQLVWLFMDRD